jgi:uncharacterized membrane protein YfcA
MDILIAVALVFVGAYVQTATGFGLAVIAAPVLFFVNPALVPAPVTVCALVLSLINTWAFREGVSLKGLQAAVIGRIPGSIAGAALLLWMDKDMLALWIGMSVLFAVAVSLSSLRWHPTNNRMMAAGFLSGFMGTSTSIGGPPMALLWQHQDLALIRANLAAFFVVSCLISLIILAPIGHFGIAQMVLSLPLLPATIAGYWVARKTMNHMSAPSIRAGSLTLCAVSGLYAVVTALTH